MSEIVSKYFSSWEICVSSTDPTSRLLELSADPYFCWKDIQILEIVFKTQITNCVLFISFAVLWAVFGSRVRRLWRVGEIPRLAAASGPLLLQRISQIPVLSLLVITLELATRRLLRSAPALVGVILRVLATVPPEKGTKSKLSGFKQQGQCKFNTAQ